MQDNLSEVATGTGQVSWNKGKLVGQKPPLKREEIWAIRIRLLITQKVRDLALFNLATDSKLRGCDLVKIQVMDVDHDEHIVSRPEPAVQAWLAKLGFFALPSSAL